MFQFSFFALVRFTPQNLYFTVYNKFWKLLVVCKLFKDIAACLKSYICESFDAHYKFIIKYCMQ